jgi:hypothetical protein
VGAEALKVNERRGRPRGARASVDQVAAGSTSDPQKRHLIASALISSAQNGHLRVAGAAAAGAGSGAGGGGAASACGWAWLGQEGAAGAAGAGWPGQVEDG